MTRRDSIVIVTLVLTLSAIGGVVVVPGVMPAPSSPPPSAPPPIPVPARPYREGILSRPESVSPLTARTQADRDLVALVFSSLVRMGPDGSLVPDLAARWSVDPAGRVWTFVLRDDARWQDGEPVTAQDVAFTIHTLQDPAYKGPAASSWSEVTVSVVSPRVVSFTLATPLGGFLQAATQPIAPAHLLGRIPIALLPDHPFGWQPIGSGPFAVVSLDPDEAVLEPVGEDAAPGDLPTASLDTGDSLATPSLAPRPARVRPYLDGIRLRFYDDARALAGDFKAGALDAVSGLSGQAASDLAKTPSTRLLRYPGSTLTAVFLNLRPTHPEFRAAASRRALFEAIDRSRLVREAFGGAAATADLPIPRTWRFDDPAVDAATDTDRAGAAKALAA
ncbi:MAG: ABC transporter substrate-binding protein, partial [Chloroflexota bacterium]